MVEDEWNRAEAEMLEQVNLATGKPTVNLTQKPGWWRKPGEDDGEA